MKYELGADRSLFILEIISKAMIDEVILVDENDIEMGTMEKIEAHEKALLHRAFSVFIFNSKGEMLLQKRADEKYHSPGLWTNACCSHPRPGENTLAAAERRLLEELGFTTKLREIFSFTYKAVFDNGLTEHEFDHVYFGFHEDEVKPNPKEVSDYCFKTIGEITNEINQKPDNYTVWFKIALPKVNDHLAAVSQRVNNVRNG